MIESKRPSRGKRVQQSVSLRLLRLRYSNKSEFDRIHYPGIVARRSTGSRSQSRDKLKRPDLLVLLISRSRRVSFITPTLVTAPSYGVGSRRDDGTHERSTV